MVADFSIKMVIEAVDRVTAPARQMASALKGVSDSSGLTDVVSGARDVASGLGDAGREAARFGVRLGAVAAAGGAALFGLVRRVAATQDDLIKSADRLGVSIEGLQKLEYAADLSGVTGFRDSLRYLMNAAGQGNEAFARLGISVTDSSGQMKDGEALMYEVADAIAALENPTRRVQVAQALFGRSGTDMLTMLMGGSAALRQAGEELARYGITTEAQARAAEAFNDNITRLTRVVSFMGQTIANQFLPLMDEAVVSLLDWAVAASPQIAETLVAVIKDLIAAVRWTVDVWREATAAVSDWSAALTEAAPWLAPVLDWLTALAPAGGGVTLAVAALAALMGGAFLRSVVGLIVPLVRLAGALLLVGGRIAALILVQTIATLKSFFLALRFGIGIIQALNVAMMANPIGAIILAVAALAGLAYVVYRNWDGIVGYFSGLWDRVTAAFDQGILHGIAAVLLTFNPMALLTDGINALVAWLFGIDLKAIGVAWIDSLAAGIRDRWEALTAWLAGAVDHLRSLIPDLSSLVPDLSRAGNWVQHQLGIGGTSGQEGTPAPTPSLFAAPAPSALPTRQEQGVDVGGSIRLEIDDRRTTVREIRSDNPRVGLDVDMGLMMSGAG